MKRLQAKLHLVLFGNCIVACNDPDEVTNICRCAQSLKTSQVEGITHLLVNGGHRIGGPKQHIRHPNGLQVLCWVVFLAAEETVNLSEMLRLQSQTLILIMRNKPAKSKGALQHSLDPFSLWIQSFAPKFNSSSGTSNMPQSMGLD